MFVKTPDGAGRVTKEYENMVSVRLESGSVLMYLKTEIEYVKSDKPVPKLPPAGRCTLKELHTPSYGKLKELQ